MRSFFKLLWKITLKQHTARDRLLNTLSLPNIQVFFETYNSQFDARTVNPKHWMLYNIILLQQ